MEPIDRELIRFVRERELRDICDYGCGTGELLALLREHLEDQVAFTGIDRFALWPEEHRASPEEGIELVDRDEEEFQRLARSPRFDLVISRFALHHYDLPVAELQTIEGLLRPGGLLYIEDFSFENESDRQRVKNIASFVDSQIHAFRGGYHRHHYRLDQALDLLKGTGLRVLRADPIRHECSLEEQTAQTEWVLEQVRRQKKTLAESRAPQLLKDYFGPLLALEIDLLEQHGLEHATGFTIVAEKVDSHP